MGMGGRELFKIYCLWVWNSVLRVGAPLATGLLYILPPTHLALLARFHSSSPASACHLPLGLLFLRVP